MSGLVHAGWRAVQRAGTITADSPEGMRFAAFGPGSLMAFPTGAVFGERWIEVGDETMIGEQVSLSLVGRVEHPFGPLGNVVDRPAGAL